MTDSFIDPDPLNVGIFSVQAYTDEDGSNRIINSNLMSADFDGNVPIDSADKQVSELEIGMSFILPTTEDLVTIIGIDYDDPDLFLEGESTSNNYVVSYLSDSGDVGSVTLSSSDMVETFSEQGDDIYLGETGWVITQGGNAVFNNIVARGKIEALSGDIGGWEIRPQGNTEDGGIFFNASVPAGESGSGAYITGIYTGFGVHTDDWAEESDIHQPSKIFMVYGPGLDPDEEDEDNVKINLVPAWNDPKTTFYVDGHGYFSLGDKLTFDANTGELEIFGYTTQDDLDDLDYLKEEDIFISGTTNISGNRIRTGILEGLVYRSSSAINRTSGNGVYLDDGGYLRVARGSSVLAFNGATGELIIEGYATDLELSGKISNGAAASDIVNFGTSITGNNVRTGNIQSNSPAFLWNGSSTFSASGMRIALNDGQIITPSFRLDSAGNATFKGRLEATEGYFGDPNYGLLISTSSVNATIATTTLRLGSALNNGIRYGAIDFYTTAGTSLGRISATNSNKQWLFFGNGVGFGTEEDYFLLPGLGNATRARYRGNGFEWYGTGGLRVMTIAGGTVGLVVENNTGGITVSGGGNITVNSPGVFSGNGSGITSLNGTNISTGTVAAARIANLDASKITSGTFSLDRIPNPVSRATNANNLDSNVTGGAKINGSAVSVTNIGQNTGTTLVRDSSNTLKALSSSRRYKENIVDAEIDPSWILNASMNPKFFNYIGGDERQIGLIAEEVNEIDSINDIVFKNSDGQPESIMYDRIAVLLVPIIREQQSAITNLENRIKYLEDKIDGKV
jgi:hypothetical protein